VVIGAATSTTAELRSRLGPSGVDVVAHRSVDGLQREPFADAILLHIADLVDGTGALRRVTAAPLLAIGQDERVAATCLAMGANAWLPAGSGLNLIAAQVQALLRKPAPAPSRTILEAGRLRLDSGSRRAEVDGRELQLAPREFDLLHALLMHRGVVLSRDRILAAAWGTRFVGEPKTVDVHVAWLRPKLEGSKVRVTTLRGIGYRLDVLEESRPHVLFVCVHNAGRSQMAAAFLNRLSEGRVPGQSAGTRPVPFVHPEVIQVMRETGIDLSDARPRALTPELGAWASRIIMMGCAEEDCPVFSAPVEDWLLPDPAGLPISAVREIRDEIERRVRGLIASL